MNILEKIGHWLAGFLTKPYEHGVQVATSSPEKLAKSLQKGDILLIEGNTRISAAIKYLTQSTWSHAAFFIGDVLGPPKDGDESKVLVEADLKEGVRAVPLSMYCDHHTRICRPVGLSKQEIDRVVQYVIERIGYQYDLKNIIDLARYLIHTPPGSAKAQAQVAGTRKRRSDPGYLLFTDRTGFSKRTIPYSARNRANR